VRISLDLLVQPSGLNPVDSRQVTTQQDLVSANRMDQ
jgi:hypothetical protein